MALLPITHTGQTRFQSKCLRKNMMKTEANEHLLSVYHRPRSDVFFPVSHNSKKLELLA